jgi:glycosyltransferase involved in cell wall biosynthesis
VPNRRKAWTPHPSYAELGAQEDGEANQLSQATARAHLAPNLPPGQPILLHFGFIRPYKGLAVLLDAMPLIQTEIPVHLLVAGEVWGAKAEYDAQIARLHIGTQVTFVDRYVPDEELASYFRAADVAVLPYLSATQSGVVQLAFGFGLPVIASHVGGLPDVIVEGETGLLVPPGDAPALAEAVIRFFRFGLGPSMTTNIKADQARFSWERMVTTIEELLTETR